LVGSIDGEPTFGDTVHAGHSRDSGQLKTQPWREHDLAEGWCGVVDENDQQSK
jgi:hypothetical protein